MVLKLRIIFSAALIFLISAQVHAENTSAANIKVGVSLPLTGPASSYGLDVKKVLEFANSKNGNKYDFIFEDDKCSAKEAVSIANKFVSELKLKYVTGYACSAALLAAAPIYEKAKVLTIALISVSKNVSQAGDYIFRTYPSNQKAAQLLAENIFAKYKLLGVLSEQTDYAQTFLAGMLEVAKNKNAKIENLDFSAQDTDLRTLLIKLKIKKVQALFINPQAEAGLITVLQQLRQLHWNVPVYSAFFAASPLMLKEHAELVEGLQVLDLPWPEYSDCDTCDQIYSEFKSFSAGGMLSVESVFISSFEGYRALDLAISAGATGKDPKQFLYDNKFNGIAGPWSFDQNGDVQDFKFVIKVIHNGKALIQNGKQ